jgi:hypothetical protein
LATTKTFGKTLVLLASAVAAAVAGAGPAVQAASTARERLAADFELLMIGQMQGSPIVPERDQKRTAKCLAKALAADIPEEDAARLSDIFEGRAKSDQALQQKWLKISAKEAPARNAQVLGQVDKLCPDLGPYVKQMM